MKRTSIVLIGIFILVSASLSGAAELKFEISSEEIKKDKRAIVEKTLELTGHEEVSFWPLYDEYQKELERVNEKLRTLITEYVNEYKTLTDDRAGMIMKQYIDIDDERLALRRDYIKRFSSILPARKVARYFQLENKLESVIRFDNALRIPLVR